MEKEKVPSQGDVVFIPVSYFPKTYLKRFTVKKKDGVIAMGDTTGNSHALKGKCDVFLPKEGDGTEMLIRAKSGVMVTHREHEDFPIKGDFVAVIEQEVDHFEKTLRRVVD